MALARASGGNVCESNASNLEDGGIETRDATSAGRSMNGRYTSSGKAVNETGAGIGDAGPAGRGLHDERANSTTFSGESLVWFGIDWLRASPVPPLVLKPGEAGRVRGEPGLLRPSRSRLIGVNEVNAKLRRLDSPLLEVELTDALLPWRRWFLASCCSGC